MKNRTITLFFLLLAALLLLSACGEASEAPPAETLPPEEEPATALELPGFVVGTWISLNDRSDVLIFTENGTLSVNGTAVELLEATENGIRYRCGGAEGMISFVRGYLSCGSPLPLSENSVNSFFYKEGEEDPANRFAGTWTLCSGEGSVRNGTVVEEFTITEAGDLLLPDGAYPTSLRMVFNDRQDCSWMLQADGGSLWCSFYDDEQDALSLGTGEGWGKYYRNVEFADLNLNNWQDYFDFVVGFSFGRDDAGNIHNSMARLFLVQKADLDILCVKDGKASVTSTPKSYAMIQYDEETETVSFREITQKEKIKYNQKYFLPYRNTRANEPFRIIGDGMFFDSALQEIGGWGACVLYYSDNTLLRDGNVIASPVMTDFYVYVSAISGTICLRGDE